MAKKPSDLERTTVRSTAADLSRELRELIRERALKRGIEDDPLGVGGEGIRTHSKPLRFKGLFRRTVKESTTTALIAGDGLVVLTAIEDEPPAVLLYRLDEIDVAEFDSPLMEDSGLDLTGTPRGATERHSLFVPADHGADGTRFREDLRAAVAAARGPREPR